MDVSHCKAVTDNGIKGLCSDEYVENDNTKRMGQCKLIHTLKMRHTNITKIGVKLAIGNLPKLRKFLFPRCVQILAELRRENFDLGDLKTYPFTEFDRTDFLDDSGNIVPYESGCLRLAASMCPSVNVVDIALPTGMTDIELQGLLELNSVSELIIAGHFLGASDQITFDGGILPLLNAFGTRSTVSLVDLQLVNLNICVNIRAIATYCPYLESLTIIKNTSYSMASSEEGSLYKEATLKKLKEFLVSCKDSSDFSSEMFALVFSSSELKSLEVRGCDVLTDDVLEEAARLHQFQNLEVLCLDCCDCVTKKGIDILMNERNVLRSLWLDDCDMIRQQDVEEWNSKARKENWNISINFSVKQHPDPERL